MSSHIFTRLGLWQESIKSNLAAEAAAKDYAARTHMAGAWAEQLHAMDYLVYAYLQSGQDREAGRVVNELAKIGKSQPRDQKSAYAFAAIPVRYAAERGRWSEAASLSLHPQGFPWEQFSECEAIIHFGRALGMAHTGDFTQAKQEIDKLRSMRDGLTRAKNNYWAGQVEIMRIEAAGTLAQAQGRIEESLKLMGDATALEDATEKSPVTPGPIVPGRELLAGVLLESNQPKLALTEFERSLTQSPDRLNGLYGAARAAELAGNREKAENYYGKLSRVCSLSDGKRPEVKRAHFSRPPIRQRM
jgi:predicted Zn-dependent protease